MAEPLSASLQAALADLANWLNASRIPATIIGGVAASALGRPRLTQDIDVLATVPEADSGDVVASAGRHGFAPRIEEALALRSEVECFYSVTSTPESMWMSRSAACPSSER